MKRESKRENADRNAAKLAATVRIRTNLGIEPEDRGVSEEVGIDPSHPWNKCVAKKRAEWTAESAAAVAARLREGRRKAARAGRHVSGPTPFGFR